MIQMLNPLNHLGQYVREYVESFIDIKYLYSILNVKPKVVESPNAVKYNYLGGEI